MSDAKKCDRCGAFYDPHHPTINILKGIGLTTKIIDLCPVCQDSLESWLTLKPKEAADDREED